MDGVVFHLLQQSETLTNLVGTKVFPMRATQSKKNEVRSIPYVLYGEIDGQREMTFDGPVDVARGQFQVDSWGRSYREARQIASAVRGSLHGELGEIQGTEVLGIFASESREDVVADASEKGQEIPAHCYSQEFTIWYRETDD